MFYVNIAALTHGDSRNTLLAISGSALFHRNVCECVCVCALYTVKNNGANEVRADGVTVTGQT